MVKTKKYEAYKKVSRKINGVWYRRKKGSFNPTKASAEMDAKKYREKGYHARIFEVKILDDKNRPKSRWQVFIRKKRKKRGER